MSPVDLDELERLAKAATPGPWKVGKGHSAKFVMTYEDIPVRRLVSVIDGDKGTCDLARGWDESCANAAYIVAACNHAPELVARVRELERQREFFLRALNDNSLCPNGGCFHEGSDLDEWDCTSYDNRECWIKAAEEAGE